MANEFKQGKVSDVGTYIPQTQVVEPAQSAGPAMLNQVGQAAVKGYEKYSLFKADQESRDIVEQLDTDLEAIEQGEDISSRLSSTLGRMAKKNPHVRDLTKDLSSLATGARQRQEAKLIYTLRAEAALKKSVARAPGLRPEIAAVASRNFGFDPSSATVDLLLKGIDQEWKAMQGGNKQEDLTYQAKKLYEKNLANNLPGVYDPNDLQRTIAVNEGLLRKHNSFQADIDDIAAGLNSAEMTEEEAISSMATATRGMLDLQLSNIHATFNNAAAHLTSEEGLKALTTEFKPQVQALKSQIDSSLTSVYGQLNLSAAGQEQAKAIREDIVGTIEGGLNTILESDNWTQAEGKVKMLELMQNEWGFDFTMANKSLMSLNRLMPGSISSVLPIALAQSPSSMRDLRDMAIQGFATSDPAARKQADLGSLISVLGDQRAFDDLDRKGKEEVLKKSVDIISAQQKAMNKGEYEFNPTDVESLSNAFVQGLQLSGQFVSKDWTELAKLTTTPVFHDMISHLEKGNDDQKFKSAVMSRAALDSQRNYFTKAAPLAIKDSAVLTKSSDLFQFDQSTGKFFFTQHEKAEESRRVYSDRSWLKKTTDLMSDLPETRIGRMSSEEFREASKLVARFNSMVDSAESLKHTDPYLSKLDKGQMVEFIAGPALRQAGVNFVGEREDLPEVASDKKKQKAVSEEKLIRDLAEYTEDLKMGLQGGEVTEDMQDAINVLDSLTVQRRELLRKQEEAENRINALRR